MKKVFSIIALLLLACGCSVSTLYNYNSQAFEQLAQVRLGSVEGKDTYLIKQAFSQEFYPKGSDAAKPKHYELDIKFTEAVAPWIVQDTSTVVKNSVTVSAVFVLKHISTGKILKSGTAHDLRIFMESGSAWSSYTSQKNAYKEGVIDILRSIRMMVTPVLAGISHPQK